MADYKYLKENNLFEAHMRFVRALGEGYGYAPVEEAEEDPMQQQDPNGGMPNGDPNAMGGGPDPMMGGGGPDDGMGGMPNGGPNPMDGAAPGGDMGGDPNGGMPPADGGADMPPMGGGPDPMMDDEPAEEDDVIDVDDLTNAQEKVNDKVNSVGKDLGKVDSRIDKLIGAIEKLQGMFDQNNQEIADLKNEFEKRNPTQTEKLNLRSLDSYPFKVRPTDYWSEKGENSNYSAYFNNQEPTTQEYVITNNDVDDFTEREIADSFSLDDDLMNMDIKRIFGL